ncbi:MAG: HypC/HybG/HupF family hydrogenase formation chaperone [Thiobacillus sp.]|nr:HypC/HybG/HupF family hydrogenase formation chaperone [Hydrogenophaga sp.]MBW8470656.1 HypC/HybG/HupF family hydrogenase formation chaperone [Thiobacillus sp.]
MCLAIPALLVELRPNDQAVVNLGGIRKEISIALVADVQVGDYVIVHVGHAIGVIDPEEAERTLALFAEMAALTPDQTPGDRPSAGPPQAGPAPLGGSEPHAMGSVGAEVLT